MNYELAKKLKDAGFPQNGLNVKCVHNTSVCSFCKEYSYLPTLSELVGACGDRFLNLALAEEYDENMIPKGRKWIAQGRNISLLFEGSTPEEAVSALWLELNKK